MKISLLLILILLSCKLYAQDDASLDIVNHKSNIISFSPLGLVNKIRLSYERQFTSQDALGLNLAMFYGGFKGLQVSPFYRHYLENKVKGAYFQVKGFYGSHDTYLNPYQIFIFHVGGSGLHTFHSFGGGVGIGKRSFHGKDKSFVTDINIGLRYLTPIKEKPIFFEPDPEDPLFEPVPDYSYSQRNFAYKFYGPGSVIDFNFTIGKRF
jgi:hypothetical protein